MVVDDEAPVRLILRKQLERAGHRVHEAENGDVALGLLSTESVDLVITDILMPEKDGLETIMALRTQHPKIKIIAISAPTNQLYLQTAISLGAHAAFPKPFGLAEIERTVEQLLESGGESK
ncbi:MAG: response regulator [Gemmatimonadetes bacterium]|nr:response regulator [Gemmatimonadota bacterium]